ncbi:MAG TPA: hypothetical protein VFQ60_02680, partial [Patescibacteria group bacterium]|nr:hypothetical protein [Patescibacteria group bacterium]
IQVEERTGGPAAVIKDVLPLVFKQIFPGGTTQSFKGEPGFAEETIINGKKSYQITMGVEGINQTYLFLPRDSEHTMVLTLSWIGDFLNPSLSESNQKKIFDQLVNSLTF